MPTLHHLLRGIVAFPHGIFNGCSGGKALKRAQRENHGLALRLTGHRRSGLQDPIEEREQLTSAARKSTLPGLLG